VSDEFDARETRSEIRKVIQLMNQYGLREFEFEDKDGERSIDIKRSDTDQFPPLLEGRTEEVPGKLRAPAVGRLTWNVGAGDEVEQGDVVAEVQHHEESTDLIADVDGVLVDPTEASHVEYGQHLGSIVPAKQVGGGDESAEENDADEAEDEDE
jgi:hypothetical protein